ncbi:inactive pancreatic lipase-related protein 1-like isoform X2 [Metopolophium dirhodum]|uniref:inactive pancreatic lipase-related protein 1-like isoform X2 n=1 Tax=Metopolophium dirhodum TaxID=44670 RepID=UPI00298FFC49|nr:inactive pancreatic lipase-related protein 1-like isoform X2 [Metopolophium dirhodum]
MSVKLLNYPITKKMVFCMLTIFIFSYDITLGSDSYELYNEVFEDNIYNFYDIDIYHENYAQYQTANHVFYWLYTRDDTDGQMLNRSEPHMIESTTYDPTNPIKVIVHGWLGSTQEKSGVCSYNVKSYFEVGNYNVICVDWKQYSTDLSYAVAKKRSKYIALDIVKVLLKITYNMTMGCYDTLHVIGHSMGAHIAGHVGKNLPGVDRITGLDPAKPMYEKSGPDDRLDMTDANYVDVMHTNAGQNGLNKSIGHMDYYPNGGTKQPGCVERSDKPGACSHVRSYHYYAHSIWSRNDYIAYRCSSWADFQANRCENASKNLMGEYSDREKEDGDYYLEALIQD